MSTTYELVGTVWKRGQEQVLVCDDYGGSEWIKTQVSVPSKPRRTVWMLRAVLGHDYEQVGNYYGRVVT